MKGGLLAPSQPPLPSILSMLYYNVMVIIISVKFARLEHQTDSNGEKE